MKPLYDCVKDYDLLDEVDCHEVSKVKTNCPNCGAPINPNLDKCEYCGTYHKNPDNMSAKLQEATRDFATSLELFGKAMKTSMQSAKDDAYLEKKEIESLKYKTKKNKKTKKYLERR